MNRKYFTELTGYLLWTNNIVIGWLEQISDAQWEQVTTSSFSSVKQTATHMVSAEKIWVDYWKDIPNPVFLSAIFKGGKNELIEIWKTTSAQLNEFIDNYPEEKYIRQVSFKWPNGEVGQMEFWQSFAHMLNHFTYHRGQLVTLLRHAGFTGFSSTDLATYYRLHQGKRV